MKLSVSLPQDDVDFLDEYAALSGVNSRSAALQRAVRLLRASQMVSDYEEAFRDWLEDQSVWDAAVGDGLAQS